MAAQPGKISKIVIEANAFRIRGTYPWSHDKRPCPRQRLLDVRTAQSVWVLAGGHLPREVDRKEDAIGI